MLVLSGFKGLYILIYYFNANLSFNYIIVVFYRFYGHLFDNGLEMGFNAGFNVNLV